MKDKQTVKTWQCDNEQQSEWSIYQFDTNMLVNLIIDSYVLPTLREVHKRAVCKLISLLAYSKLYFGKRTHMGRTINLVEPCED